MEGLSSGAAYGLALNEQGTTYMGEPAGLLYVANGTSSVRCYNTFSWELVDTIDMGRQAAGIGLDIAAGHLYAGYFDGQNGFHHYLIRRDLNGDPGDPETLIEKDLEAVIMDISADPNTGIIYTTTDRSVGGSAGTVEVYDPTNWISTDPCTLVLLDTEYDEDFVSQGPAGIAIGPRYKPPDMFITKVDNIGDCDPNDPCCVFCVEPDDFVTYSICYHPGPEDEYNVVVTDYLPNGVSFISADPCENGYYTPQPSHTYTWEIGFVPGLDPCAPGDPNDYNVCLELTVQVNEWAEPYGELLNIAEIESDVSYNKVKEYTPVCCWTYGIIYVDATAKSPKNAAKTTATLQNQVGKVLLTLASMLTNQPQVPRPASIGKTPIPTCKTHYAGRANVAAKSGSHGVHIHPAAIPPTASRFPTTLRSMAASKASKPAANNGISPATKPSSQVS